MSGKTFDTVSDEEKVKILDQVDKWIWESTQDAGSKREASKYNRKLREELVKKISEENELIKE